LHRNSHYYEEAREFGRIVSSVCQIDGQCEFVIVTGGGPGVMEAANRGAAESGAKSIGLSIVLPEEQVPNPYVTPELCFRFNYFAIRKMHFLLRAKALVAFPGGFGTLDELFETLTLLQTRRIPPVPVLLFGRSYWSRIIDFEELARQGTIDSSDLDLFKYVESAQEAWASIAAFHGLADRSSHR
ncbi:MAG: TIGR00730 family Rossman fold protein, partial [Acidobacteriota bacterium]